MGDVSFEVTYDGLTQTVSPATGDRDAGVAAPLYDEPTIGVEAPCTSEGFATPQVQPDVSCVVNAPQRTPYLPGHGWAEDGRTFVLVTAFFTVDSVEVRGTLARRRRGHAATDPGRRRPAAPGRQVRRARSCSREPPPAPGPSTSPAMASATSTISLDCVLDGGGEVTLEQTVPLG